MTKEGKLLIILIIILPICIAITLSVCALSIGTSSIEVVQDTIPVSIIQGDINSLSAITVVVTPYIGAQQEVSLTVDMLSSCDITRLSIIGTHNTTIIYQGKTCMLSITLVEAIHIHTYGAWSLTLNPTCTTAGCERHTCTDCSYEETREVVAVGHTGGTATCTVQATCTRCSQLYGEPLGHDYESEFTIDNPATCTTVGSKSRYCTRCDIRTEITEVPATGHNLNPTTGDCSVCDYH
ncbi:MAG: hypothetical protein PHW00_01100 [Clostridia bacterium]|nr:hypothetical protein [Clostridia bacterium]